MSIARRSAARRPTRRVSGVAHLAAHDEAEALACARRILGLPAAEQPRRRAARRGRPTRSIGATPRSTRSSPTSRRKPYDMHDVIERVVDDGEFLEIQPGWAAEHHHRLRAPRRPQRRHRRAAAGGARRRARHRRLDEGGAVRAHLRLLQRAAGHASSTCPGFLPGVAPGARRDHPPRREAALRLLRGDGAEADGHHAQGVRRRLRRHVQQAHPRRRQPRLADRARSRSWAPRARSTSSSATRSPRRPIRRGAGASSSPTTRSASPTRTSPRRAATSTT